METREPGRPGPSRGRRRLFTAVTALLPAAFLLLLEGGLRAAGLGSPHPLFLDCPDEPGFPEEPGFLCASPTVVRRFVVDEQNAPRLTIAPVPFRREKPADAFRIFVQGGSTAKGYPYGHGASLAGMLQQRLDRTFPGREIEVVSTATSAVNSYTLLDFSGEILAQQPDAVLIYAGHNEYLGILGVGSEFSVGRRRPVVLSYLALKDLAIFQTLKRALLGARQEPAADGADEDGDEDGRPGRTLMATIAAERHIPYGSPLYRRGLEQYRANLGALLRRYRRAGVPVLIGTIVSNERDQRPFQSGHGPGADTEAWELQRNLGMAALESRDAEAARRAFAEAVAIDDLHAEGHFRLGRALEGLGRFDEARRAYLAAKDRDELRFRAPEEINAILREVAALHGAHVVEVQEAFVREARNGIVGREFMLEHLHPNVPGYFLLADAFYEALHRQAMIGPWERVVPREQAMEEIPLSAEDRRRGERRIRNLMSDWPFTDRLERASAGSGRGLRS